MLDSRDFVFKVWVLHATDAAQFAMCRRVVGVHTDAFEQRR